MYDLELSSITEISSILKGRRKVSHRLLEKVLNYLDLNEQERLHLKLIAELDRSRNSNTFLFNILQEKVLAHKKLFF